MKISKDERIVLAGDIGGTKTNLGLFSKGKNRPRELFVETFSSREAPNLNAILAAFIQHHPVSFQNACFGVAGPVKHGRCKTTNLPWEILESEIKEHFGLRWVRLLNDLTATALAIPLLKSRELRALNRARADRRGHIGLIAPGTGLGMALLVRGEGNSLIPVSSEGGHADFAPNSREQADLWQYLRRRWRHVSLERLLSGSGLLNIYSWLKDSGRYREPFWLRDAIRKEDPAKIISETALAKGQPLCRKALKTFVSILGSTAGNLALTGMTTGGIYLGGGIPPRILPCLQEKIFIEAFRDKGRFEGWMRKVPVKIVLNDRAALLGAAHAALEMTTHHTSRNNS